ncbi:MAG: nucleoside triphosphate pyrophosphohydrolase [Pacificimonas sp.]
MIKKPADKPDLSSEILRLRDIMAALRNPDGGCPWDLEQDFASISAYTIEEAYEVADAIQRGDMADLRGELGDLLLQTVYHARMAEEIGAFDLTEVVSAIADKMVRRHPHVFGDGEEQKNAVAQKGAWEKLKAEERGDAGATSALDGVAKALPALMRAEKLQKRAARVGFDWPDASGPRAKIDEEMAELHDAKQRAERIEEAGDLMFSVVNYLRHLNVDAETALRLANDKFERRFRAVETASGTSLQELDLDALERLWQQAKAAERR